jgi:hypothetical protein
MMRPSLSMHRSTLHFNPHLETRLQLAAFVAQTYLEHAGGEENCRMYDSTRLLPLDNLLKQWGSLWSDVNKLIKLSGGQHIKLGLLISIAHIFATSKQMAETVRSTSTSPGTWYRHILPSEPKDRVLLCAHAIAAVDSLKAQEAALSRVLTSDGLTTDYALLTTHTDY